MDLVKTHHNKLSPVTTYNIQILIDLQLSSANHSFSDTATFNSLFLVVRR